MRCMGYCPENAIEAGHSLGVIFYFVAMTPIVIYLIDFVASYIPNIAVIKDSFFGLPVLILDYVYILISLFISYLLFIILIRIPFINVIFTFTTLTHFYRRYHEPNTKIKDFKKK